MQVQRRTGGRSARVREDVLHATLQALAEDGGGEVHVGQIARAAGVHETSIYRRWGTREHLVMDALLSFSEDRLPVPDTGALRSDLIAFATSVEDYLSSTLGKALVRSMTIAVDDPPAAAMRTEFWAKRKELALTMFERAVRRNELRADLNHAVAIELLIAPLHFKALLTRERVDGNFIAEYVDQLMTGFCETE